MIFTGFIIGLQFIADNPSVEQKKEFWRLVLEASVHARINRLELYELYIPAEHECDASHYVCTISVSNIKEGRILSKTVKSNSKLLSQLDPLEPILQENIVEGFASNCIKLGDLLADGTVVIEGDAEQVLPKCVDSHKLPIPYSSFLIAADSMKGVYSSLELNALIASSLHECENCKTVSVPVGDGGEGTVDALVYSCHGRYEYCKAHDASMNEIVVRYGVLTDRQVVIECAQCVGFSHLDSNINIKDRTSYGVGEMIAHALNSGYTDITLCIGGTTTADGGIGMLKALGFELNGDFNVVSDNVHTRLKDASFRAVCDVNNPLLGEDGAINVYARQKGASEDDRRVLEERLEMLSKNMPSAATLCGSGSGGGIGYACAAILNAELVDGANYVLDRLNFAQSVKNADLVITGEGSMDIQTVKHNKLVKRIVEICQGLGKPLAILAGHFSKEAKEFTSRYDNVSLVECCSPYPDKSVVKSAIRHMLNDEEVKNSLR